MGSSFVELLNPFFGQSSDFADIVEKVGVQNGFPIHAVKSFDISVLYGTTGLNTLNLNFMFFAPPLKFL